jgi:hypothetical protein
MCIPLPTDRQLLRRICSDRHQRAGFCSATVTSLLPTPDDARILQLFLTPPGRSYLGGLWTAESTWLTRLLLGLGEHEMAITTQVIKVVRQRLERDARELAQRKRIPLQSGDHKGDLS